MPPPPRHRTSTSGRPSTSTPMSERQQLALLMQMTSSNEAELSPNSQTSKVKDRNERGETALHICAKKGDLESAKKLLEQGIDPNITDFAGWTPLHEATNHGHYHIAQLLIKNGANVNAAGLDDITPLHDAASFGNQKLVKMLIDKGADITLKNKKGKTAQDIAHPSLITFFRTTVEMANKRDSQQHHQQTQQQKKTANTENKKSNESYESSAAPSDVYEFVSTPKHSSCSSGSGDENPSKTSEKSSDDKSGTDSDSTSANPLQKRVAGEQHEAADTNSSATDDDAKRKKRLDVEPKDVQKVSSGPNKVTPRVGQKPPGPASKTMGLTNKSATTSIPDRKSPSEMSKKSAESEEDNGDDGGPKVPPLKIVIPQQVPGASEIQETQNISHRTTSKTTPSRNHPYVVASSNSNDGNASDGAGARSHSPSAESNKSDDTGRPQGKSKEPRILRSSRKDAKDDRGSNNSSPQLPASSTPSPLAQNAEATTGNESENQQNTQNAVSTSIASSSGCTTSTSTTVVTSTANSTQNNSQTTQQLNPVDLHPRKRKIKASSREPSSSADVKDANSKEGQEKAESIHPHDQPFTNCYQMYIDLRKQIEQRHRNLHPVEPRPLKGLEDYLMNRRTYLLQGKSSVEPSPIVPSLLPPQMKETFIEQEKERHKLKLRHIVEKEKLVLSKEQEILRVHCKAAQMQANQSQPFSVCTILKDEEVYNSITPEHEERYNNRSFFKELKDLDDKYDKIKEAMITRHTNEAESLMAVQKMDWGWKMKELALCEYKTNPEIEELHVPMIDVSDEYNTTPSIKN